MTTESITSVPATEGQKKQIRNIALEAAESAVKEIVLTKAEAQRLIEQGARAIKLNLVAFLRGLVVTDEFADEEVESNYGYLSGYKPRPVAEQLTTLKKFFPTLKSFDESAVGKQIVTGAEGNFLIPRWQEIAPTYNEAVEIVLAKLSEQRNGRFYNYRQGALGPQYLRQTTKKAEMFQKLGDEQKGHDVLVVQAQFGIRHRGKSVRRVRVVMGGNEVGLGAFEVGIMLLTYPDRLAQVNDLWIDCAGDEYAHDADGVFSGAPYFGFYVDELRFGTGDVDNPNDNYGSASVLVVAPSE